MTCPASFERHDGLDPRPVRLGLSKVVTVRCSGCRAGIEAMGVTVHVEERRREVRPVPVERRRFVPAWRARLTAVDHTGELVAR